GAGAGAGGGRGRTAGRMSARRIFKTTTPVLDGPEGHEEVVGTVRAAVDLEEVIEIQEGHRFPGRTVVIRHSSNVIVDAPFEEVLAAWEAYREWADAWPGTAPGRGLGRN